MCFRREAISVCEMFKVVCVEWSSEGSHPHSCWCEGAHLQLLQHDVHDQRQHETSYDYPQWGMCDVWPVMLWRALHIVSLWLLLPISYKSYSTGSEIHNLLISYTLVCASELLAISNATILPTGLVQSFTFSLLSYHCTLCSKISSPLASNTFNSVCSS